MINEITSYSHEQFTGSTDMLKSVEVRGKKEHW